MGRAMRSLLWSLRLFVFALVAGTLNATWSIILVDMRTGEIAIASATCLTGFDLESGACVVVVGHGAAAAQSFVDTTGQNRQLIFAQLQAGTSPAQILALLAASDSQHQTRQYGIVDVLGRAIGFTGTGAGQWAGDVAGQIGTIAYAIQGNVLTGAPVVNAALQAVQNTPGDLADKLMAAMEAARLMGGDGRCSCSNGNPTGCGSPPPTFTKAADVGYMLIARPGDLDGICNAAVGCANGSYYMNLNVANSLSIDPDPVLQLRARFLNWRLQHVLRPDHFLSTVEVDPARLLDDGITQGRLRITLRDWRGVRLPFGGAQVAVAAEAGSPPLQIGAPIDNGDGSYTVPIGPAALAGTARLRVTVNDGLGNVRLAPSPEVAITGDSLWLSSGGIDAFGGSFDAVLRGGVPLANRPSMLVASFAGTTPGIQLAPGIVLPLNPDALTYIMVDLAQTGSVLGGLLDAQGRRTVPLSVPPGLFLQQRGSQLDFAFLTLVPIDFTSNPATLQLR
jgi:hypothetical protein